MALLWAVCEEDIVRGLPIESLDDLTGHEIQLMREYADMVLDTAAREFLDALAARIRGGRGWDAEE